MSDCARKLYGAVTIFCKHQRISGKEAQEPGRFPVKHQGSDGEAPEKQARSQEGEREREVGKGNEKLPPKIQSVTGNNSLIVPQNIRAVAAADSAGNNSSCT